MIPFVAIVTQCKLTKGKTYVIVLYLHIGLFFFCQSGLNEKLFLYSYVHIGLHSHTVCIQEQLKAVEETNMLLKKENDDLTEKYMRMAMSHDVTCLIQEHMQKKEMTISGLKERIADLEQKVT